MGHKSFQCRNKAQGKVAKGKRKHDGHNVAPTIGEHGRRGPEPICWHCGQLGHKTYRCTNNGASTKSGNTEAHEASTSSSEGGKIPHAARDGSKGEKHEGHCPKTPLSCWDCGQLGHTVADCTTYGALTEEGARQANARALREKELLSTTSKEGYAALP